MDIIDKIPGGSRTPGEKRRHYQGELKRRSKRRDENYWTKPIYAIDSEGVTDDKGVHRLIMVGVSGHDTLISAKGLTSIQILNYLFHSLKDVDSLNVIYGGSYDFNMWLHDMSRDELIAIYRSRSNKYVAFEGYKISWTQHRWLRIYKDGKSITIYDVLAFYQCKFLKACDDNLGDYEGRAELEREKNNRPTFQVENLPIIEHYMQLELKLLIQLVTLLRSRLHNLDLKPSHWSSPGAITTALFRRYKVGDYLGETPKDIYEISRLAYGAGRFELLKYGVSDKPAYEYDINSAYPDALRYLPRMDKGYWIHNADDPTRYSMTVYRVTYTGENRTVPGPLFYRDLEGNVSYPTHVVSWIWSPEFIALQAYCRVVSGASYQVLETYSWVPIDDYNPFEWIATLYKMRAAMKAAGDGTQQVVKLGMNSAYGKLCQQVGWSSSNDKLKLPRYHKLELAGYITSSCRAKVLTAALQNIGSVIAFETDALFTTEPLDLPNSNVLGEWKMTKFDNLSYIQSGIYFGDSDKETTEKSRGIDRGNARRETIESIVLSQPEENRTYPVTVTRFGQAGQALSQSFAQWCRWNSLTKNIYLGPSGKRVHIPCQHCDGTGILTPGWHDTMCPEPGGLSEKYSVEWQETEPSFFVEMRRHPSWDLLESELIS